MKTNPRLTPSPLVSAPGLCKGTNKQGNPCGLSGAPGHEFCLAHDPERTDEYKRTQQERGRLGVAARRSRLAKKRSSAPIPLSSTEEIRQALEKALGAVNGAKGADVLQKADKVARVCSVALATLRTAELERDLRELREEVERLAAQKAPAQASISGATRYPVEANP